MRSTRFLDAVQKARFDERHTIDHAVARGIASRHVNASADMSVAITRRLAIRERAHRKQPLPVPTSKIRAGVGRSSETPLRQRFLDHQFGFGAGMRTSGLTSKSRPQNSRVPRM